MARFCMMLDLRDDPDLIASYEAHHRAVWPEVLAHLQQHGVREMQIYRLGTRMTMVMETDDAVFDAERMRQAEATNPTVQAWEALMWTLQAPTPWTPAGQKWTPMAAIFDWRSPPADGG